MSSVDGGGGGGGAACGGAGAEAVEADWFVPSADPSDAGVVGGGGVVGAGCWNIHIIISTCADSWAICSWLTL